MSDTPAESRPIVVVGSHVPGLLLEVDAVPREGETVLGRALYEPEDGGKATNQAVAAAKLGAPVRVVTLIGDDERGERWRAIFERHGLDLRWLIVADGPTDVGVVMLPPSRIPAIVSTLDTSTALDAAPPSREHRGSSASSRRCPSAQSLRSGSRAMRVRGRSSTRHRRSLSPSSSSS